MAKEYVFEIHFADKVKEWLVTDEAMAKELIRQLDVAITSEYSIICTFQITNDTSFKTRSDKIAGYILRERETLEYTIPSPAPIRYEPAPVVYRGQDLGAQANEVRRSAQRTAG